MLNSQYLIIKQKLAKFIAVEGTKRLNVLLYATDNCSCSEEIRKEALLYMYALSLYQINIDGSTTGLTNYLTTIEFNNILNKVERISQEILL